MLMDTIIQNLPILVELAKTLPWFIVSVALFYLIYKAIVVLYNRLFSETGIVKHLIDSHIDFMDSIKLNNERSLKLIEDGMGEAKKIKEAQIKVFEELDKNTEQIKELKEKIFESIDKLDDNKNLFTILVDDTSLPICFFGKDLRFERVNTACCLLLGYESQELMTKNLRDLVIEKNNLSDNILLSKVISGEVDRYRIERIFIGKNGEQIPVAIHLFRHPKIREFNNFVGMIFPLHPNKLDIS